MSHSVRPSQIAAIDPVAHRPKSPPAVKPLARTLEPLGDSLAPDVASFSTAAQALMSADAARTQAPSAPMADA